MSGAVILVRRLGHESPHLGEHDSAGAHLHSSMRAAGQGSLRPLPVKGLPTPLPYLAAWVLLSTGWFNDGFCCAGVRVHRYFHNGSQTQRPPNQLPLSLPPCQHLLKVLSCHQLTASTASVLPALCPATPALLLRFRHVLLQLVVCNKFHAWRGCLLHLRPKLLRPCDYVRLPTTLPGSICLNFMSSSG